MPQHGRLILDTGPLVLLVMAVFYDRSPLALRDSLVRDYTEEQLDSLETALERSTTVLLSPFCLAESTNLIRTPEQRQALGKMVQGFEPCWGDIAEILSHPRFPHLGVADVSLLLLAQQPDTFTLTADRDLYMALSKANRTVIYFCIESGNKHIVSYPE